MPLQYGVPKCKVSGNVLEKLRHRRHPESSEVPKDVSIRNRILRHETAISHHGLEREDQEKNPRRSRRTDVPNRMAEPEKQKERQIGPANRFDL